MKIIQEDLEGIKFDIYTLDEKERPLVIICPGGAYTHLSEREAAPVALKYITNGINVAIVYYSLNEEAKMPKPIKDLAKVMFYLKSNNLKYKIDSENVFVCGFSAGGHVAAGLGVFYNNKEVLGEYANDFEFIKPKGLILCYPVIDIKGLGNPFNIGLNNEEDINFYSLQNQVSENTPNTFIWHSIKDKSVPYEGSMKFVNKLMNCNIDFEIHIFSQGSHGIGLANELTARDKSDIDESCAAWFDLSVKWIKRYEMRI